MQRCIRPWLRRQLLSSYSTSCATRGIVDIQAFTQAIKLQRWAHGLSTLKKLQAQQVVVPAKYLIGAASRLKSQGLYKELQQLIELVADYECAPYVCTTTVAAMRAASRPIGELNELVDCMEARGIAIDHVFINELMLAASLVDNADGAHRLFSRMQDAGYHVTGRHASMVVHAYGRQGELASARQLNELFSAKWPNDTDLAMSILRAYAIGGDERQLMAALRKHQEPGGLLTQVTASTILHDYEESSKAHKPLSSSSIRWLRRCVEGPDIGFHPQYATRILKWYSQKQPFRAVSGLFYSLPQPTVAHFGAYLSACARHREWQEAVRVIELMKRYCLAPDAHGASQTDVAHDSPAHQAAVRSEQELAPGGVWQGAGLGKGGNYPAWCQDTSHLDSAKCVLHRSYPIMCEAEWRRVNAKLGNGRAGVRQCMRLAALPDSGAPMDLVRSLWEHIRAQPQPVDPRTLSSALIACSRSHDKDMYEDILEYIRARRITLLPSHFSAIIAVEGALRRPEGVLEWYAKMKKAIYPDEPREWQQGAFVQALGQCGQWEAMQSALEEEQRRLGVPCAGSMVSALSVARERGDAEYVRELFLWCLGAIQRRHRDLYRHKKNPQAVRQGNSTRSRFSSRPRRPEDAHTGRRGAQSVHSLRRQPGSESQLPAQDGLAELAETAQLVYSAGLGGIAELAGGSFARHVLLHDVLPHVHQASGLGLAALHVVARALLLQASSVIPVGGKSAAHSIESFKLSMEADVLRAIGESSGLLRVWSSPDSTRPGAPRRRSRFPSDTQARPHPGSPTAADVGSVKLDLHGVSAAMTQLLLRSALLQLVLNEPGPLSPLLHSTTANRADRGWYIVTGVGGKAHESNRLTAKHRPLRIAVPEWLSQCNPAMQAQTVPGNPGQFVVPASDLQAWTKQAQLQHRMASRGRQQPADDPHDLDSLAGIMPPIQSLL